MKDIKTGNPDGFGGYFDVRCIDLYRRQNKPSQVCMQTITSTGSYPWVLILIKFPEDQNDHLEYMRQAATLAKSISTAHSTVGIPFAVDAAATIYTPMRTLDCVINDKMVKKVIHSYHFQEYFTDDFKVEGGYDFPDEIAITFYRNNQDIAHHYFVPNELNRYCDQAYSLGYRDNAFYDPEKED